LRTSAWFFCLVLAVTVGCESDTSGGEANGGSVDGDAALADDGGGGDAVAVPDDTVGGGPDVIDPVADAEAGDAGTDVPSAPAGACINGEDLNGLQAKDPRATVQECAQKCMATPGTGCATSCIEDGTSLSVGCAACFGAIIECLYARCGTECTDGSSPDCDACTISEGCVAEFTACSGISPPK
jgi:hypothetical protein